MPLFNFKCVDCGVVQEHYVPHSEILQVPCRHCHEQCLRHGVARTRNGEFRPFWHPNLAEEPVYIESRKHAKALEKQYNCYLHGVLD